LYKSAWDGYGKTKNKANSYAKYDWIMSLDGDEILSDGLITEIKQLTLERSKLYSVLIAPNFAGYWVKHSGWYPKYYKRLFHKADHQWNYRKVHESLNNPLHKKIQKLKNLVHHYSITSIDHHLTKIHQYARLQAEYWHDTNTRPSLIKRCIGPYARFFRNYIVKLGFLDGKVGWTIAVNEAKLIKLQLHYYYKMKDENVDSKTSLEKEI
jgi:hypothetical protein